MKETSSDPEARTGRLPRALRPFAHHEYRLLATSMAASLFASGLWLVAIVYQVIALDGGPSELSLVAAAASAGLLVSVLIGGVAADRLPRRAVMIGVEIVRIASAGLAGALAVTGALQLWHLAVIAFVIGAAEAFFYPAYSAILPTLLPPDELLAANGVEGTLRPTSAAGPRPGAGGRAHRCVRPGGVVAARGRNLRARARGADRHARRACRSGRGGSQLRSRRPGGGFRYLFRTGWLFATLAFATLYVLVLIGPIEVLLPFAVQGPDGGGAGASPSCSVRSGSVAPSARCVVSSLRLPRRYLTAMILLWGVGTAPMV